MNNSCVKNIMYLQVGDDKDINVCVNIITKEITFDENIKDLSFDILKEIFENAKDEINKGGYDFID